MSRHDWKAALKVTNCRGNLIKIAKEMRDLTYEELHDPEVAFEIAFERACDLVGVPGDLHTYYSEIYRDYITLTVRFEDRMRRKFCYSGGYSIGLGDEVVKAAMDLITNIADSTEKECITRDWLIGRVWDRTRSCNMPVFEKDIAKYLRSIQKALIKNIQSMRRLDNARIKTGD